MYIVLGRYFFYIRDIANFRSYVRKKKYKWINCSNRKQFGNTFWQFAPYRTFYCKRKKTRKFIMSYDGNHNMIRHCFKFLWVFEMQIYLCMFLDYVFCIATKIRVFEKPYGTNCRPIRHFWMKIWNVNEVMEHLILLFTHILYINNSNQQCFYRNSLL